MVAMGIVRIIMVLSTCLVPIHLLLIVATLINSFKVAQINKRSMYIVETMTCHSIAYSLAYWRQIEQKKTKQQRFIGIIFFFIFASEIPLKKQKTPGTLQCTHVVLRWHFINIYDVIATDLSANLEFPQCDNTLKGQL